MGNSIAKKTPIKQKTHKKTTRKHKSVNVNLPLASIPPYNILMDIHIYWAMIYFAVAAIFIFLEILLPTGGLLGLFATIAALLAILTLFQISNTAGFLGILITLVVSPLIFAGALKIWPHTPIGKMLTLKSPKKNTPQKPPHQTPPLHAQGKTLTPLQPVGTCLINEQKYTCIAQAGAIDPGQAITVVSTEGLNIKVIPAIQKT